MNNKNLALEDIKQDYFFVVCKKNFHENETIEYQKHFLSKCYTYHFRPPVDFSYGRVYAVTKVTKRGLYVMTNDFGKTSVHSPQGFERC